MSHVKQLYQRLEQGALGYRIYVEINGRRVDLVDATLPRGSNAVANPLVP
jgi:hypothetical protein